MSERFDADTNHAGRSDEDEQRPSPYRVGWDAIRKLRKRSLKLLWWTAIPGLILSGIGLALIDVADGAEPVSSISAVLLIVGVMGFLGGPAVALYYSAIAGGQAIWKGGGWIGGALITGLLACAVGWVLWGMRGTHVLSMTLLWGGITLMVLSTIGFWIIGWIAKVPMWVQAPIVGSPRVYVRGQGDAAHRDVTLPNALDDRAPSRRAGGRHARRPDDDAGGTEH